MAAEPKRVTTRRLLEMKRDGERIVALTAYDALFADLLDQSGVDVVLVGDSLNTVLAFQPTTVSATLEQMLYHTRLVVAGVRRALVVIDLPFMSYQVNVDEAKRNAGRALKETGVAAVKLEGGAAIAPTVRALVDIGIPVMGHVGMTPQSVHAMGGYRVQGREQDAADRILADARALEDAGAFSIVLELIPAGLAKRVSESLAIPTIGIGSGAHCDGQVLVLHDMLGLNERFTAKFVKHYARLGDAVKQAVKAYSDDVRSGKYPDSDHSF
jgi:3-methyl-2-oxobutanoate hydroxymethyltransferase